MSRVDLGLEADEYDSDEGALLWEDDDVEELTGGYSQASLTALAKVETARKGVVGRGFEHMKRLFAGAEIEEPEAPHTLVAFRDAGFEALEAPIKTRLDTETPAGKRLAAAIVSNHVVPEYVDDAFLNGETGERERVLPTLDDGVVLRILPPRVPKKMLPAGARIEEPILRLETAEGVLLKQTTARRAFDRDPTNPYQQVIVVNEPLAKWARPKRGAAAKTPRE